MEIDINLIKKLQNTDDETLKATIKSIAQALGANDKQVNNAVSNVCTIKKKMSRMSDNEIKQQVDKHVRKIGDEKADEILRQLKL